ncbi:MAG: carboxypeptidase-like regulatory domain-containing protein, partial [Cytophagales bacterium]
MLLRHFSTFVLVTFFSFSSYSQGGKGKIAGKIIDKSNGEDLIGAVVQIEGTNAGAATDIEGKYVISVEPGIYTVILTYISYKTEKIQGVEVKPGQVTYLNFAMKEDVQEMEEVVITYTVEKSSTEALLIERKNTTQVSDGVSADQIRKTPDRSTADVLKRVTGASIQEGKFAIIRGMNDRYNAGYLDGAPLPSTETDRKAFAFDVIPAALIDKVVILKAGTPDLTGDFGGGVIQISTKSVPEKFTQQISVGGQYHSLTTFNKYSDFGGKSKLDWMGYDSDGFYTKFRLSIRRPGTSEFNLGLKNGPRAIPNDIGVMTIPGGNPNASTRNRLAGESEKFNFNYTTENYNANINPRFGYTIGMPIKIGRGVLGVLFSYSYSDTRKYNEALVDIPRTDDNEPRQRTKDQRFFRNISSGGILNVNYKINPNHLIG